MIWRKLSVVLFVATIGNLAFPFSASAQYKLFVGAPPGGSADILSRLVAKRMASAATENTRDDPVSALQLLVNIDDNGHNYLLLQPAIVLGAIQSDPTILEKIQGVSFVGTVGLAVTVSGSSSISDTNALITLAKTGKPLKIATTGQGSLEDICARQLLGEAGVSSNYVTYSGFVPMMEGLLKADSDFGCLPLFPVVLKQHLPSNRLKALAFTSQHSQSQFPNVPTLDSLGVRGVTQGNWYMFVARKTTDKAAMQAVVEGVKAVVSDPSTLQVLRNVGLGIDPNQDKSPEAADQFLQQQISLIKSYTPKQ